MGSSKWIAQKCNYELSSWDLAMGSFWNHLRMSLSFSGHLPHLSEDSVWSIVSWSWPAQSCPGVQSTRLAAEGLPRCGSCVVLSLWRWPCFLWGREMKLGQFQDLWMSWRMWSECRPAVGWLESSLFHHCCICPLNYSKTWGFNLWWTLFCSKFCDLTRNEDGSLMGRKRQRQEMWWCSTPHVSRESISQSTQLIVHIQRTGCILQVMCFIPTSSTSLLFVLLLDYPRECCPGSMWVRTPQFISNSQSPDATYDPISACTLPLSIRESRTFIQLSARIYRCCYTRQYNIIMVYKLFMIWGSFNDVPATLE